MPARRLSALLSLSMLTLAGLSACGGGGGGDVAEPSPVAASAPQNTPTSETPATSPETVVEAPVVTPAEPVLDDDTRRTAAAATANSLVNDCYPIRPFYWELGNSSAAQAGGSVDRAGSTQQFTADTVIALASSSKWLYAAYVAQRRGGQLTALDERMLTARSGYISFSGCRSDQSVDSCLAWQNNDRFTEAADGHFFYSGGHFQKHASLIGLGAMNREALAAEWQSQLGADLAITMAQPQPAGGAVGTAAIYAGFLRKLLRGDLALAGLLGSAATCASPEGCPAGEALYAPANPGQTWHYSLGHWVEDDPVLGDGSFSSAGGLGFYPWVDSSRTLYGIVARQSTATVDDFGAGAASARCGRLIRQAWKTGVAA